MNRYKRILSSMYGCMLRFLAPIIIDGWYKGFWNFRTYFNDKLSIDSFHHRLYYSYLSKFGSYIGSKAYFASTPVFPHDMYGVFISNMSRIGKNVVIFQQVTIGSNTIKGHPRSGSPTIGDNVYIGAGAKIIGKVTIGDNCRIGANCVVVKDMPPNTTAVAASTRFIESDHILENTFVPADEFIRHIKNEEKSLASCNDIMRLYQPSHSPYAIGHGGEKQYVWIEIIVYLCCATATIALSFRYRRLITDTYNFLAIKIRNRIYGYKSPDKVYPLITPIQEKQIANAIKISFTGDLILLREMIERAYNPRSGRYEFDSMFEHVSPIWKESDLAIGVFEGPLAGDTIPYSTSNYDDGVPLTLNFPDTFAEGVKNAGIDLVTLANNHIFDVGIKEGLRTLKILDSIGLDHVGLAQSDADTDKPKIVIIDGKRIGILAYTFAQNGKTEDFFFGQNAQKHIKPVLSLRSKYFKKNQELIRRDFQQMRNANPDMIIVLPHMGEQFLSKPDKTQRKWCDFFVELGADIIFADHPHHVQPIEWRRNKNGKQVLVVYCPGNFINSYTGHDGDASMIVSAYLNKQTLEPFAVGVTPIYAHCPQYGMWTGLPTYKAVTDKRIYNSLSRADYRRIDQVNRLVTGISLNARLGVDAAQKEYLSFADTGFVRTLPALLSENLNYKDNNSAFLSKIKDASSICFVGDSVTDGTKNGGFGWYEPLLPLLSDKSITRFALGSRTSRWLLDNACKTADIKADLYVVAIGCNDIRYRRPDICAMTAGEYIDNLEKFVDKIKEKNSNADFVFVAPWRSLSFDANFNVKGQEKRMKIYQEYTDNLAHFCSRHGFMFLDPNPLIFDKMTSTDIRCREGNGILKDFIHPDAYHGIRAYCKAVMECTESQ